MLERDSVSLFFDSTPIPEVLGPHTIQNIISACHEVGIDLRKQHIRTKSLLFHRIGAVSASKQRALREYMLEHIGSHKRKSIDLDDRVEYGHRPSPNQPLADDTADGSESVDDDGPFLKVPKQHELDNLIGAYLDRTSNDAISVVVCGVCARELDTSKTVPYTLSELPNKELLIPTCSHPSHVLTQNLLVYPSSLNAEGEMSVCRDCERDLLRKQIPPLSLVNNMWIGNVPTELTILTLPERLLISRYFPSAFIVKLTPKRSGSKYWDEATRYSGVKGNVSTYAMDTSSIAHMIEGKMMPKPAKLLEAVIGVAFVGFKAIKDKQLPSFLHVRRSRVRDALLWLKENNPLYRDIEISEERLCMLPVQGVPLEILDNTRVSDDLGAVNREQDGYVPDLPEDDDSGVDVTDTDDIFDEGENPRVPRTAPDSIPCVIPIQSTGVVDVSGDEVPERELFAHALHNTFYKGLSESDPHSSSNTENYMIRKGSAFVSEYGRVDPQTGQRYDGGPNDPNHLLGCFPWLFPWGLGGFEVFRHVDVSYENHAKWALQYADKRFRKDMHFVFQIFGVIQKRKICSSASLQITRKSFLANEHVFRLLKPADFIQASKEEASGVKFSNGSIQALRTQLRAVRVRVPGTDESRSALRGKIWGAVLIHSPPSLWITINPSDLHDPIAQVMTGEDIDLSHFDRTAGPTSGQRAINISSDPYAASRYFHFIINVVLETLFGIKVSHDKRRFLRTPGIAGLVQGYIGTVEAQNRGSLHLHMIIWLTGALTSAEMKQALQSPEFRDKMREFVSSVVKADIDGSDTSTVASMKVEKELSYARPPDPRQPNFEDTKKATERKLARAVQFHTCDRDRCLRMKNNKLVCKRRAPWQRSLEDWVGPNGQWGPRRLCVYLNNWNSLVLICLACNNDVKLLTNTDETRKSTWYITTYSTKKQGGDSNVSAVLANRLAYHAEQEHGGTGGDVSGHNKRLLQRCANAMSRLQQFSAPEAISYLMGWGDRFESHHYVTIYWDTAVNSLKRVFPELRATSAFEKQTTSAPGLPGKVAMYHEEELIPVPGEGSSERVEYTSGSLMLKDQLKDYAFRGPKLAEESFLDFMLNTYEADMETRAQRLREEVGQETISITGRTASERIPYMPARNKHDRARVVRAKGHETLPHFVGAWFPRNDNDHISEFYCASMLMLLSPWTDLSNLKGGMETFSARFDRFKASASHRVLRIIDNIQYYHEAQTSAREDAVDRGDHSQPNNDCNRRERELLDDEMDVDDTSRAAISLYACTITEEDIERARSSRDDELAAHLASQSTSILDFPPSHHSASRAPFTIFTIRRTSTEVP